MAALDFPDNPTNGQVFDKWTWNGTMWVLTASGSGGGGSGFTFNQDATPTATKIGDTWFETDTGDSFVWTNDGNSTQWVQFAPGSGGGGGSGFTYVTDTKPTPSKVGDTWFDTSTLASGGTSWLAIEESPGGEKVWVQFAPGVAANPANPVIYTADYFTGVQTVNGTTFVISTAMRAATVTGSVQMTVVAQVHSGGTGQAYDLRYTAADNPVITGSGVFYGANMPVPVIPTGAWVPAPAVTLFSPCTVGVVPKLAVAIFCGVPGQPYYYTCRVNVVEYKS